MSYFEDKQGKIYIKWMILVILLVTFDDENCLYNTSYYNKVISWNFAWETIKNYFEGKVYIFLEIIRMHEHNLSLTNSNCRTYINSFLHSIIVEENFI